MASGFNAPFSYKFAKVIEFFVLRLVLISSQDTAVASSEMRENSSGDDANCKACKYRGLENLARLTNAIEQHGTLSHPCRIFDIRFLANFVGHDLADIGGSIKRVRRRNEPAIK